MEDYGGQVSSGYGVESNDNNVDSAGIEIKRTTVNRHDSSAGKLFVGGLSWETTEETFIEYFCKYGQISDSVIMTDKYTGRPRGFGFVTFADPANADKVLDEDHVIDGRMVEVKRTVPREHMEVKGVSKTKKIFVGGIPPSLTEDELNEYFSSYGSIVESQIMLDHNTGRPRGFGFVTFETEDSVERIFSGGEMHELGGKQVEIKKAEPKRPGGDYSGGATNSYGGYANGGSQYGRKHADDDQYGEKMDRGHSGYSEYGSYAGTYGGNPAEFYGSYGGYGYGYGFNGAMYNGGGYGYGASGYMNPGGYAGASGYDTGNGFGFGFRRGASAGYGGGNRGHGNGSSMNKRYHPYQR